MRVGRGAAGAAFASPILSVGTACRTNKIRGLNTKKMAKKRDENRAKEHPRTDEIAPFFLKIIFGPSPIASLSHSLAPSELNFASPIEMII